MTTCCGASNLCCPFRACTCLRWLPYDAGSLLSHVREYGNVDSVDYRADGIWIEADVDRRLAAQIVDRAIDETDGDGSDHIDAEHDVD